MESELHPALKVLIILIAAGLVNKLLIRRFYPPTASTALPTGLLPR